MMPEHSPRSDRLSLVVPMYNEAEVVDTFFTRIEAVLARIALDYEIIVIDDGSRDDTVSRVRAARARNPRIKLLVLSRNFGKEAALSAGLDAASGDAIIPVDADLQDPPELIEAFIEKWREGYDVVYGLREARASDTAAKRVTASLFYRFFNRMSPVEIPNNAGDYRLMDRRVVDALKRLPERNRFMKGLFSWVGFRQIGVPYARATRAAGTSKFNYWKLWNFAIDGITSFSTAPLRLWTYIGVAVALIAFIYSAFLIARVIFLGTDVPGYASIMVAVLALGGIQLISLGVIGEYLGRLYSEVKLRPTYLIQEADGFEEIPGEAGIRAQPASSLSTLKSVNRPT